MTREEYKRVVAIYHPLNGESRNRKVMTREELMGKRGEEVCKHCEEIGNFQDIADTIYCGGWLCRETQDDFAIRNNIELED